MTQVNAPPTPRDREIRRELRSWQSARASCITWPTPPADASSRPCLTGRRRRCRGPSGCRTYSIRRSSGGATGSRRAIPTKPRR